MFSKIADFLFNIFMLVVIGLLATVGLPLILMRIFFGGY